MDPVGAHGGGDIHRVVDDADDALFPAQRHKALRLFQKGVVIQMLFPQLHDACTAVDGGGDLVHKGVLVRRPGPVRHSIEPQLYSFDLHRCSFPAHPALLPDLPLHFIQKNPRTRQIRWSAANCLMISLRWHDPNQVMGQSLSGLLSARQHGLPVVQLPLFYSPGSAIARGFADFFTKRSLTRPRRGM